MGELEDRRLQAEIANFEAQAAYAQAEAARLSADAASRQRLWRDWFVEVVKVVGAIVLGAGGLVAAFTGYQLSELKKERTDLEIVKARDQLAALNEERATTDKAVSAAQQQLASIRSEMDGLQVTLRQAQAANTTSPTINAALAAVASIQATVSETGAQLRRAEQQTAPAGTPARYLVGVQVVGPASRRDDLNRRLTDAGYSLHMLSGSYDTVPDWFAARPTVLYYAKAAEPAARALAASLRQWTNKAFVIQRGAGLGVDPSERDVTLFVHDR